MTKRMTIVFDDEALYTALKVESARTHRPAKDIVATALELFFEATPAEFDALLARSRGRSAKRSAESVDRVLQELGLKH